MKQRHHTPEQVIRKLAEDEKLLAEGKTIEEVSRHLEISEQTWHRWRNQYGGMKADDPKRLKELERENVRLKRIVADQALDIEILKELHRGNFWPRTAAGGPWWPSESGSEYLNVGPVRWSVSPAPPNACAPRSQPTRPCGPCRHSGHAGAGGGRPQRQGRPAGG